jgi:hypothetical protein
MLIPVEKGIGKGWERCGQRTGAAAKPGKAKESPAGFVPRLLIANYYNTKGRKVQ